MSNLGRAMAMYQRRIAGESLQEIGKLYNLSRERVRQILKKYYPEYTHVQASHKEIRTCAQCGKKFFELRSSRRKFCDRLCSSKALRKNRTVEEIREMRRLKASQYYHSVKNTKHYKELKKKWNEKSRLKLYGQANKEN